MPVGILSTRESLFQSRTRARADKKLKSEEMIPEKGWVLLDRIVREYRTKKKGCMTLKDIQERYRLFISAMLGASSSKWILSLPLAIVGDPTSPDILKMKSNIQNQAKIAGRTILRRRLLFAIGIFKMLVDTDTFPQEKREQKSQAFSANEQ